MAKKKETTMSQMTSLQKAEKHCEKVSVLVATTAVAVRNAHAPVGSGSSTRPAQGHEERHLPIWVHAVGHAVGHNR